MDAQQYSATEVDPEMDPDDPKSRGVGEAYISIDWLRFWQVLKPDQQAEHLDRWHASPAWRKAIAERQNQYSVEIDRVALRAFAQSDTEEAGMPRKTWWQFLR